MAEVTVVREQTTLDLLLYKAHGERGAELLEAAYELNDGIAFHTNFLPIGMAVKIPDLPVRKQGEERQVVTLFG
jgi:phage tail protein X